MKPSEVIQQRGWTQFSFLNPSGVCAEAAIYLACHTEGWWFHRLEERGDPHCDLMLAQIEQYLDKPLDRWNDTPGRTAQQVIVLLQEFEIEFESETVEEKESVYA